MTQGIRNVARVALLFLALIAAACSATTDPHATHAAAPAAFPSIARPALSSGAIQQMDPPATLAPDEFDAPDPISVAEADKAAKGVDLSDHAAHSMSPGDDHSDPPMAMPMPTPAEPDRTTTPDAHKHGASAAPGRKAPAAKRAAPPSRSVAPAPNAPSAKPAAPPSPRVAPATTIYTCPMHPEVTSSKPGNCPKCGMTLVKKK